MPILKPVWVKLTVTPVNGVPVLRGIVAICANSPPLTEPYTLKLVSFVELSIHLKLIDEVDPMDPCKPLGATGGRRPVPESLTYKVGLAASLFLIANDAVRVPPAVGVNVTLIVQFAPGATPCPQVSLSTEKSVAFVPVMVRLLTNRDKLPATAVLESVTV